MKFRKLKFKILVAALLFTAILCAIFIRTVPNYSNELNIGFTTIFGKKKYEQGYCLSEDKILDKEEKFRRGVLDYFIKIKKLNDMLVDAYCDIYGYSSWHCDRKKDGSIFLGERYFISDKIKNDEWLEFFSKEYNKTLAKINPYEKYDVYKELFTKNIDIKSLELKKDSIITFIDKNTAKFQSPIISYNNNGDFIIISEKIIFQTDSVFKQKFVRLDYDDFKDYSMTYKELYSYGVLDNCGNVNFNVKESFNEIKKHIGKGG